MVQFAAWMDVYPQHHNCVRTHMGDRWYIYILCIYFFLFIYLFILFNVFMYVLKLYYIYIYTGYIWIIYIYISWFWSFYHFLDAHPTRV